MRCGVSLCLLLQLLDLAPEGLVHRDHVVELACAQPHERPAELAQPALRRQDLLPVLRQLPLRFQELKASEVALASLCPRYFKPSLCVHACRSAASSGSSLMTQSASPGPSTRAGSSWPPWGSGPPRANPPWALRRSRVQK